MTALLFGAGAVVGVSVLAIAINKLCEALDNRERKQQDKPHGETNNNYFLQQEREDNDEYDTF